MKGKATEAVVEVAINELNDKDNVDKLLAEIDKLYLKDKFQLAYEAYNAYEDFHICLSESMLPSLKV